MIDYYNYKELKMNVSGETAVKYVRTKTRAAGASCFRKHWHDQLELLCVTAGTLNICLNNEDHVTARAGQAAIVEPRTLHQGTAGTEGVTYYALIVEFNTFANSTAASEKYLAPLDKYSNSFEPVTDHPEILKACGHLAAQIQDKKRNPLCITGTAYALIGLLYQHCCKNSRVLCKSDSKFQAALEYINEHFAEKISTKDISSRFGYDETYFCKCFREVTGMTTMNYIKLLRLEMARKLLGRQNMEIGDISWKCGFSDVSYFSNCFKKQYGESPASFRRNLQG